MLRWRLFLGVLLIAALVGLCWLDHVVAAPGVWLMPVAAVLALMASDETCALLRGAGIGPVDWVVRAGSVLLVVAARMASPGGGGGFTSIAIAFALVILCAVAVEVLRYKGPGKAWASLASTVFAVAYVGLMLAFLVRLRMDFGVGALAALLLAVKPADTGAYAIGKLFGRHKLAPVLSPGKTIEGAVGALAFGVVGSWVTFVWLIPCLTPPGTPPWRWWEPLGFGLLMAALGMLGDLAESLLKREAGVKDSSTWLPGFGGVLDMLDSVLLAAPGAYLWWLVAAVAR